MKNSLFTFCLVLAIVFTSCNNNEPENNIIKDGKISISMAAPFINGGTSQTAARMITGDLSKDNITFKWEVGDVVEFKFYDNNKSYISGTTYTVQSSDLVDGGLSISITVEAPNTAKYATAATGPTTIPNKQYHKVSGISSGNMRFESEKTALVAGENTIEISPIWSALIITPQYNFYYNDLQEYERQTCTSFVGMDKITVSQTIGTNEPLSITYSAYNDMPIKKSGNEGAAPSASYIVVVYPATQCALSVDLWYDKKYFKGSSSDYEFEVELDESKTTIQKVSMHTNGQTAGPLIKANAYDINVMQHPLEIYWVKKQ